MTRKIDLNADLGEGMGEDAALMPYLARCNIACGGHAGDEASMTKALGLARAQGVLAGAHPSYPDREGFGRRRLGLSLSALDASLTDQLSALKSLADRSGQSLAHVKPHGALYHDALTDPALAALIADVAMRIVPGAALVHMPGGALSQIARARGLAFLAEGFVDRGYLSTGDLVARGQPGAMIETQAGRIDRALALAAGASIAAFDGAPLTLTVDTICLHGDSPDAAASAKAIAQALNAAGFTIAPHGR
jgi:UPF0271 protein